jgi:hypothetical protein
MRYFVGFLIIIGLLFIGVLLMVRLLFGGSEGKKTTEQPASKLSSIVGTTKSVHLTVDMPINADQVHRQVKIDASTTQSQVRLITGYEDQAVRTEINANNPAAFGSFLEALDAAGFTNGDKESELSDERGLCPQGKRYVMEIRDGAQTLQRYWATSCGDKSNFKGDYNTILRLFKAQVPDYRKTTKGLQGYAF